MSESADFVIKCGVFQGYKGPSVEVLEIPDGVAHFLEHKLFESETGDAFAKYAKRSPSSKCP